MGHCGVCRRKWRLADTDLCPCGETQMMSHIVESCTLIMLNGGLSRLHSADEDWRICFLASQLWFMTCIQEEEEEWESYWVSLFCPCKHRKWLLIQFVCSLQYAGWRRLTRRRTSRFTVSCSAAAVKSWLWIRSRRCLLIYVQLSSQNLKLIRRKNECGYHAVFWICI